MPNNQYLEAAILVIDQASGTVRQPVGGAAVGLDLAADVGEALDRLTEAHVRVALAILRDGAGPASTPVVIPSFDGRAFEVRGAPSDWLARVVADLGVTAARSVLIAVDLTLRAEAHALGFRAAPHALVATWLVSGREPMFVRLEAPREVLSRMADLLPYFVEQGPSQMVAWAAVPAFGTAALVEAGASVQVLRLDPVLADPYLCRFDVRQTAAHRKALAGARVVWSDGRMALLEVTPCDVLSVEMVAARRHGALQASTPSTALLRTGVASWVAARLPGLDATTMRSGITPESRGSFGFAGPTSLTIQTDVARYSGAAPLDAAGAIVSRHVRHPHATRAVQALMADLEAVGYIPYAHTFSYNGTVLSNVIADLPGKGLSPFPAQPLAVLRNAVRSRSSGPELLSALTKALGHGWAHAEKLDTLPSARIAAAVERRFGLGGWVPWWHDLNLVPGFASELVIVACHLDSTASGSAGFSPTTSPAPGADDDASGIAATLAAARELSSLRGMLTHTLRFCFFNAEEQGLLGSAAYANHLKSTGAPVKAVIVVDMAGYDIVGAHQFEIHAGATDPAVRDASVVVAQVVAKWAADTTNLAPAQIYRGTSAMVGADRDLCDPAIGRADHASFHQQGWPAVVVSEDYFVNRPGEEASEPNPNYHRFADTTVNATYVADIARAITRAAEELAQ